VTLRTVSTPLDPILLTEWRTFIGIAVGVDYTNMVAGVQAEFQFLLDEAYEWVDKTYGHQEWAQREWRLGATTISAPSTANGTFLLPIDCRHPILFQESENGTGATSNIVTKRQWMAAGANQTAHPWTDQLYPYYFFDGMDDSEPSQAQWRRVPTPSATIAAFTALGRGYFDIMGTTGNALYQSVPAAVRPEIRHHLKATFYALRSEYDKVGPEMQMRDDAVKATMVNDAPGGSETVIYPGPPNEFTREMSGP